MKLSYKNDDFTSTVIRLKDGRCLEVRRGALTGKAIPDPRTWASEEEWRAWLPSSVAPKLEVEDEVEEIKEEAKVVEIPAEPSTSAAEFTDTVQRLVKDLRSVPAACHALSDLILAAPAPLRDHIRRDHYFLTLLRGSMYQHKGEPYAETVLTAYTPLF